jgi:hypothetical protein
VAVGGDSEEVGLAALAGRGQRAGS